MGRLESLIYMSSHILSTEFLDGQGLGNQLWAYAATRSLSERLGFGFKLRGFERFKGSAFLSISEHVNISIERDDCTSKLIPPTYHERQYYDPELKLLSTYFDEGVLNLRSSHDLKGYFQSEQYFFGDIEKLKHYFIIDAKILEKNSIPSDICVLNLRGGEYKRFKDLILPQSYWQNAQKNMMELYGISKFLVVTDDYRYAKKIFPQYEIVSGNVGDCYAVLNSAKYVVASNSSFSYFPIKTNLNSPIVIAPQYWSRFNNSYKRWAAPANFYADWLWQGADGEIQGIEGCIGCVQDTIQFYRSEYFVSCPPSQLNQGFSWKILIPTMLRPHIKKFLSYFFPTKIG